MGYTTAPDDSFSLWLVQSSLFSQSSIFSVISIASPDIIVWGSSEGAIKIWNYKSGLNVKNLVGYSSVK